MRPANRAPRLRPCAASLPLHAPGHPAEQASTRPAGMSRQRALDAFDLEADLGDAIVVELACNQRDGTEPNAIADFDGVLVGFGEMLAEREAGIARAHRQRIKRRDVAE